METDAAKDISARARQVRRRGLSIPDIPLGVKVLAILIVLDGFGSLLAAALAPFQEEAPGHLTGSAGVAVGLVTGALLIWLGRNLYRGSRLALDFLIGGYVVLLAYGLVQERWPSVDVWMVFGLGLYGAFLVYLLCCRPVLSRLENMDMSGSSPRRLENQDRSG